MVQDLIFGKVNVSENGRFIMKTQKTKAGFTLVEILIVVVILGILAAIVIPQFTQASTEARENSLRADLQTIRSQIELYKIQHNDDTPGSAAPSFENALIGYTLITGASCAQGTANALGPYLQAMPVNPFNLLNTVDEAEGALGDDSHGWAYNDVTNDFRADDSTDPCHKTW
jgi:general secretion pathway protein G